MQNLTLSSSPVSQASMRGVAPSLALPWSRAIVASDMTSGLRPGAGLHDRGLEISLGVDALPLTWRAPPIA